MNYKTILWTLLIFTLFTPVTASLSDYPMPFVKNGVFNARIVVGKSAATSDVLGGIDIAASLIAESNTDISLGRSSRLLDSHIGVLDVNAPELGSKPMIVVGGPCVNTVAAKLMNYPQPCNKGFTPGKAKINYYPDSKALLVAGFGAQETLAASYILADYDDYNLSGNRNQVTIAEADVLNIQPVE